VCISSPQSGQPVYSGCVPSGGGYWKGCERSHSVSRCSLSVATSTTCPHWPHGSSAGHSFQKWRSSFSSSKLGSKRPQNWRRRRRRRWRSEEAEEAEEAEEQEGQEQEGQEEEAEVEEAEVAEEAEEAVT
jgi:hypothetical protein